MLKGDDGTHTSFYISVIWVSLLESGMNEM